MQPEKTESRWRLDTVASLEEAQPEWTALAEAARNPFATWEWASVWWRHYGNGRPLVIGRCTDGAGAPAAILPLYLARRRPARILRFLGHGPGDHLGPICRVGSEGAAHGALEQLLGTGPQRWDVFLAERLPVEGGAGQLGRQLKLETSPQLPTRGLSWQDFLAERSSNFRGQVRRRERKLGRDHRMSYRLADDPAGLETDMDTLARLHDARWAGGGSGGLSGAKLAFHKEFAALALQRGWLRLWFLEVDENPVAAWYGFRFAGDEWYYQSGRDPAWDAYSVGFVLLCHTIRETFADGLATYRFLRGNESYKDRFATEAVPLVTTVRARGGRGRAVASAALLAARLPPQMRRRLAVKI